MNYNKRFNQYSKLLKYVEKKNPNYSKKAHTEIKNKVLNILIPFE